MLIRWQDLSPAKTRVTPLSLASYNNSFSFSIVLIGSVSTSLSKKINVYVVLDCIAKEDLMSPV